MQLPKFISKILAISGELLGHTGFQVLDRIKQATWLVAT
jgi:hypothetical protein